MLDAVSAPRDYFKTYHGYIPRAGLALASGIIKSSSRGQGSREKKARWDWGPDLCSYDTGASIASTLMDVDGHCS